jgi:hypothetical protein
MQKNKTPYNQKSNKKPRLLWRNNWTWVAVSNKDGIKLRVRVRVRVRGLVGVGGFVRVPGWRAVLW